MVLLAGCGAAAALRFGIITMIPLLKHDHGATSGAGGVIRVRNGCVPVVIVVQLCA